MWRGGGVIQTCRRSQLGGATPSPRTAPSLRLTPGAECRNRARTPAPPQPGRARAQPRPQRALLCSWASAVDSPLPLRPLARSPENGRGGAARGPAARRPSHPSRPARPPPARLLLAQCAHRTTPLFSILCFSHFYTLCRGKLVSVSLLIHFPPCLILPRPLCLAPSLPLSASSSYSH